MTETIGSYEIIEQIGSGGMATVYKGYQAKLERYVAIKVMHENFARDKNFLARFEREARIVARLDHPNIVPLYDYDEHNARPYLVMKFIEGVTLKDVLFKRRLNASEIVDVMAGVADALHYAHEQGILHRDIKPSNIMIDRRGIPYLTDFGLARIAQQGESTLSADSMLGTPHYISPEQAQGNVDLDARTDVYSLGVVLYELVTGRVPFTGESSYAIIHNHIYEPPPPPREIDPSISMDVEDVLLRALSKNPAERYSTPVEMIDAYKIALGTAPARAIPTPQQRPQYAAPPPSGKKRVDIPAYPPQPPQPPQMPKIESPFDELRHAGEEMRRAFESMGQAFQSGQSGKDSNRQSWRPGAKWTTDPLGNQGFYTDEELRAMEAELPEDVIIRKRVEKRLEERRAFLGHLTSYILVNALMVMIWLFTDPGDYFWPVWVMGPWGIGLVGHGIGYFTSNSGRDRRERFIQREMERERERLYGGESGYQSKVKNDRLEDRAYANPPRVRLNEDGEFTDSFIQDLQDLDQDDKRKR